MRTARKNRQRYYLDLGGDREFKLSASEWQELLGGGWICPTGIKHARLKPRVIAWVRGGDLFVFSVARIRTVTASWLRAWMYSVGVIRADQVGGSLFEKQDRVMLELDREAQNEALLWRTRRNAKGPNEFAWIPVEAKAEIIRAFRRIPLP